MKRKLLRMLEMGILMCSLTVSGALVVGAQSVQAAEELSTECTEQTADRFQPRWAGEAADSEVADSDAADREATDSDAADREATDSEAADSEAVSAVSDEKRKTDWDLTDIFEDQAAFDAYYEETKELVEQAAGLQETLNSVDGVLAWYAMKDEYYDHMSRMSGYTELKCELNVGDNDAIELRGRVDDLYYEVGMSQLFDDRKLLAQDSQFLDSLEQDERMEPYLVELQHTRKTSEHQLDEEQENLLAPARMLTLGAEDLFNIMVNLELPFQEIEFPDGVTRAASADNIGLATYGGFDQAFRKAFNDAMLGAYSAFRNTFAQNYQNYCTGESEDAKVHGYGSVLEKELEENDVEPELYQSIIDASLSNSSLIGRYAELMKSELGLDKIYGFDMNLPIAPELGIVYTYDEACELVLSALAPLGDTYVADARTALAGGWVDVYPAEGKQTYSSSMIVNGVHPYMLLNFDGTYDSVSALAHELGHTMNDWYSDYIQPTVYRGCTKEIVAETASTMNELLLSDYMIKNAQTKEERKYYLAQEMHILYFFFFAQAETARFQQISMEALENGELLTADRLDRLFLENNQLYSGDVIESTEASASGWARSSMLYMGYREYQYCAAIAASCDIAQRITAGEAGAVEDYLTFISAGDSGTIADMLRITGVDATNSDFIDGLIIRFENLMEEYQAME